MSARYRLNTGKAANSLKELARLSPVVSQKELLKLLKRRKQQDY